MTVRDDLTRIADAVQGRFEAQKRVLGFEEYLDLVLEHPGRHTRDAARYLRGAFDHYGHYAVQRPWGPVRRYRLFDQVFAESFERERSDRLVGQEALQESFYRVLSNFVREGRANRLVLLHGPNGSAKTTFVHSLMAALEHYSTLDEGALYRFSWVFPRGRDGKTIGFGSSDEVPVPGRSFAHLPDANIDVKLPSELREHPLLLLPRDERRLMVREAYEKGGVDEGVPDWISEWPARPQEPADLRGAPDRLSRRPRQGPRPRAGGALLRLAALPRRRGHHRPARWRWTRTSVRSRPTVR